LQDLVQNRRRGRRDVEAGDAADDGQRNELIARGGDPSGSDILQTGMLRGMLGIALSRTGRRSEALRELEAALPAFAGEESGIE